MRQGRVSTRDTQALPKSKPTCSSLSRHPRHEAGECKLHTRHTNPGECNLPVRSADVWVHAVRNMLVMLQSLLQGDFCSYKCNLITKERFSETALNGITSTHKMRINPALWMSIHAATMNFSQHNWGKLAQSLGDARHKAFPDFGKKQRKLYMMSNGCTMLRRPA